MRDPAQEERNRDDRNDQAAEHRSAGVVAAEGGDQAVFGDGGHQADADHGDDGTGEQCDACVASDAEQLVGAEPIAGQRKRHDGERAGSEGRRSGTWAARERAKRQRDAEDQERNRRRHADAHWSGGSALAPTAIEEEGINAKVHASEMLQQDQAASSASVAPRRGLATISLGRAVGRTSTSPIPERSLRAPRSETSKCPGWSSRSAGAGQTSNRQA